MNKKRFIIIGGIAGGASAAIPPHTQAPMHVRGGSGARKQIPCVNLNQPQRSRTAFGPIFDPRCPKTQPSNKTMTTPATIPEITPVARIPLIGEASLERHLPAFEPPNANPDPIRNPQTQSGIPL